MDHNERLVADVLPEQAFDFSGHGEIRNLFELVDVLKSASPADFGHHVNSRKNDIANWIADVYCDTRLAAKIRQSLDRQTIIGLVEGALTTSTEDVEERLGEDNSSEPVKDRIKDLSGHISRLEDQFHHMTGRRTNQAMEESAGTVDAELLHDSVKRGIAEFGFGLVIGIFIGLIIAKMLGLY